MFNPGNVVDNFVFELIGLEIQSCVGRQSWCQHCKEWWVLHIHILYKIYFRKFCTGTL